MKVDIGGLEVIFPYDYMYPEQFDYMFKLASSLGKGHIVLEMPTGTGKTVSLLSLILAFQHANPDVGKLVYCTRTVQEMDKVVEELHRVMDYRNAELAKTNSEATPMLGICLSSRRNLCIHEEVSKYDNRNKVDAMCRNMTAQFVREDAEQQGNNSNIELCEYYEGYEKNASVANLTGIYSIEEMRDLGREKKWCPYFAVRHFITMANVVVYNYQYMLDPKISNLVSKEIEANSIIVFDEAHNIDNICIEALSVTLDKRIVQASVHNVTSLTAAVAQMQQHDAKRLQDEYNALLQGLQGGEDDGKDDEKKARFPDQAGGLMLANPLLPADLLQEAVPGSIRRARNFLFFLRTLNEYMKGLMERPDFTEDSPETFIRDLRVKTGMQEIKALKFAHDRLNSLLRTLRINNADQYTPLQTLCSFATLVATYSDGFSVIYEAYDVRTPTIADPKLQLCCLDASLAIKPVFDKYASVVITSGTLSPLNFYPKILDFRPAVCESFSMSITRDCICPLVVTKGQDQIPISSNYNSRYEDSVVQNYGRLIVSVSQSVPDGVICFFTSYMYMEQVVTRWDEMGIVDEILPHKLIFVETEDIVETSLALDSFKKACDIGRGGLFLSVARGKVAEGIDFDGHYGRAVILMGVPFQYTLGRVLKARLAYCNSQYQIPEAEFLTFDAIRQASQCLGRVIRSKMDYGLMIFADSRYSRNDKRKKLPQWITQFLRPENWNLDTGRAISEAKTFLRKMAQPHSNVDDLGVTMLTSAQIAKRNQVLMDSTAAAVLEEEERKMAVVPTVQNVFPTMEDDSDGQSDFSVDDAMDYSSD